MFSIESVGRSVGDTYLSTYRDNVDNFQPSPLYYERIELSNDAAAQRRWIIQAFSNKDIEAVAYTEGQNCHMPPMRVRKSEEIGIAKKKKYPNFI